MEKQLRERLEELHAELEDAPSVDEESRELLRSLLEDIRELLERSGARTPERHASLTDRLREATRHFEESHPTLATTVGRVADALSNLGI